MTTTLVGGHKDKDLHDVWAYSVGVSLRGAFWAKGIASTKCQGEHSVVGNDGQKQHGGR